MTIDLAKLAEPFPPERVSWRVGATNGDKTKGLALAYIDSRDVQDRLDEVCGPENWSVRHPWCEGKMLACEIGIRFNGEWIWKGDGAGQTDVEAEKGAFSDAFKRAAVRWKIGRYLYDVNSPWVAIEAHGKSFSIKESEYAKLRGCLPKPGQGASAPKPEVEDREAALKQLAKGIRDAALLAPHKQALDSLMKVRNDDLFSIKNASEDLYLWVMKAVNQKYDGFTQKAVA